MFLLDTNDAVLVTHNTGEFSRITGLRMEDWQVGPIDENLSDMAI